MLATPEITEQIIRDSLMKKAQAHAEATGRSYSAIGILAVGDSKFLNRVSSGLGFNIKTYQRMLDWLSSAEHDRQAEPVL